MGISGEDIAGRRLRAASPTRGRCQPILLSDSVATAHREMQRGIPISLQLQTDVGKLALQSRQRITLLVRHARMLLCALWVLQLEADEPKVVVNLDGLNCRQPLLQRRPG